MKYPKLLLRGRIDEFNGHFCVGKYLESIHWHGRLLSNLMAQILER